MRNPLFSLTAALLALVLVVTSASAASLPEFTELAAKCGPAVVNINTEKVTKTTGPEDFFGDMFRGMPPGFERYVEPFQRDNRLPHTTR